MGVCIVSGVGNGIILVNPINVSYLSELSGNSITSPADLDLLQYDSASDTWVNRAIPLLDPAADELITGSWTFQDEITIGSAVEDSVVVFYDSPTGETGAFYVGYDASEDTFVIANSVLDTLNDLVTVEAVSGDLFIRQLIRPLVTKLTNYTAQEDDYTILLNAFAFAVTATLPPVADNVGRVYNLKCIDATNLCSVATFGAEEIDGSSANITLSLHESITVQSDGSAWWIL
jgi:hypothetical protein